MFSLQSFNSSLLIPGSQQQISLAPRGAHWDLALHLLAILTSAGIGDAVALAAAQHVLLKAGRWRQALWLLETRRGWAGRCLVDHQKNHRKTMRKPWENHRKTMGTIGKPIGKWWFHGILMGFILWKTLTELWKHHHISWENSGTFYGNVQSPCLSLPEGTVDG